MTPSASDLLAEAVRAFQARDRDYAAGLLARLNAEDAPLGDDWGAVARLAATVGEVSVALAASRRHVALKPYDVERRLAYGALLAECGRIEGAEKATRAFLPNAPRDARLHLLLGTCQAQLGKTEAALADLRTVLDLDPAPALISAAWLAIADLKRFTADDPDIATLQALILATGDATPSGLYYALAKALDDAGEVEAAFEAYETGARSARALNPPNLAASRDFVDQVIAGFTRESLAKLPPSTADSDRPIFVLGLPRSGTTLVEQILASHSGVKDGAELNLFRAATMALGGYTPSDVSRLAFFPGSENVWTLFGRVYLHLLDERFGPEGRIVDKTLNHTRMVGLIHHVLPGAKFVWLRRDPADTALSCFRSHFVSGLNWSWSLEDIAAHFADEDRLHAHWSEQFPEAILTVPYEDLVQDPEIWIARILEHCGLPFQSGVRDFHLTERAVTTSSSSQVRQPLNVRGIGAWRRYEAHMRPFLDAYGGHPA
ncbi:tetratricopeptide repeat-containing sulfotransferase family protein [Caulobacter henricii]|uniref:Uncharacterized protein n=1 Tax=Caulobacter henricii TaxID=69395 RepID=A0A0P0P142_9CAUL|nr:sulfotransferase [Caulobacter henricii]ALL14199.1 hypothetical protein AQ619_13095 [Caulobacter henricii]